MSWLQKFTQMLQFSGNDDDEKGRGRKVPSGFEKILKRTRKGITHDSKESSADEEKKTSDDSGDSKKKDEESKKRRRG